MNHRSIPSLSSSISSNETNQSPRTSSSFHHYNQGFERLVLKKSTEASSPTSNKRWDDSQLGLELAEDDLISYRKVRRSSSLRLKQKLQLSESYFKSKFSSIAAVKEDKKSTLESDKFSQSIKRIYHWILS